MQAPLSHPASNPLRGLRAASSLRIATLVCLGFAGLSSCGDPASEADESTATGTTIEQGSGADESAAEAVSAEAARVDVASSAATPDHGPIGAPLDAAPASAQLVPEMPADEGPVAGDDVGFTDPGTLADIYAEEAATGSADERDALAAAALGPEVLAMRAAAKERAQELEELSEGSEYAFVDFERLVFEDYSPPEFRKGDKEALALEAFPEDVRGLDGKKVQLAGFMIAVDFKDKKVEDFMLCRFPPGCCFGGIPLFDEWVDCTPTYEEKRDWSPYEMILVEGTLEVGEVVDEDGFALSIYRMKVDDVRPFE